MPYPIERKLVVAVSSSALFDMSESDGVFRSEGEVAFRKHQRERKDSTLQKGVAFPFVRRLLSINTVYKEEKPVEVVVLSRSDPESGIRVFRSIATYGLDISRASFLSGKSPWEYLEAFNSALFLSANTQDVRRATIEGHAAGTVLKSKVADEDRDLELRMAFDFDGVIADDEAEAVYKTTHNLELFHQYEKDHQETPLSPGPLQPLLKRLSFFQRLEQRKRKELPGYRPILRIAIVTSRNAPSHERYVNTMSHWGMAVDETFFLGGMDKSRVLKTLKPHIFFDDQMEHLGEASKYVPSVHIPFGIANK